MNEINEMIIAYNTPDNPGPGDGGNPSDDMPSRSENSGTIILDATCASQNISYPQDINLLNEARENPGSPDRQELLRLQLLQAPHVP